MIPQQSSAARVPQGRADAQGAVQFLRGFHDEWSEAAGRWAAAEAEVSFASADRVRFLSFWVLSEFRDLSQQLRIAVGRPAEALALPYGWSPVSVEVPAGESRAQFSVNKLIPAAHHSGDARDLGVRLRGFMLHGDPVRHRHIVGRLANAVANTREMMAGRVELESTPPNLGIDMYGVCNIKPPCVYCAWDESKVLEGDQVDAPFTLDTLREWGPFFDHTTNLVNCSIGEPFMMKNVDELLDAFAEGGKTLEMATNGQILTDTNIQKLIGRPIELYVSFDAATPETYAVLRNRRFDLLKDNVRRLVVAKGGRGRLPLVNVVFMPMKANLAELDRFVALCAELGVDHLVLRPLNYAEQANLNWDRAGYRFEYEKELLPFDALVRASGRAAELCRRAGVPLSDQMDFGGSLGGQFTQWFEEGRRSVIDGAAAAGSPGAHGETTSSLAPAAAPAAAVTAAAAVAPTPPVPSLGEDRIPACVEPWKRLYILRRGVLPCCYGGRPIAPMDQYREAWNSTLMQDIRRGLASGRFHRYCEESPACPIVRKAAVTREQSPWHGLRVAGRRAADALDRQRRGLVWAGQWAGIRLRKIASDPNYIRHHLRRVFGRR